MLKILATNGEVISIVREGEDYKSIARSIPKDLRASGNRFVILKEYLTLTFSSGEGFVVMQVSENDEEVPVFEETKKQIRATITL